MNNPALYVAVGAFSCFLGTIPFGPINLTVVKTAIDYNKARGTEVALAASIVEVGMALIAICFGFVISAFLEANAFVQFLIALVFIILAVLIFNRESKASLDSTSRDVENKSMFASGFLIAALNPQAIPFLDLRFNRNRSIF